MADVSTLVTEFVDACNAHDLDKAVASFAADGDVKTYVDATPDVPELREMAVA